MMQATRGRILQSIQRQRTATIRELSDELGVAAGTLRHHLDVLERQGLIAAQRARGSVGRPENTYSLTEAGLEHFPAIFQALSGIVVEQMKTLTGVQTLTEVLGRLARTLIPERVLRTLATKSPQERAAALVALLEEEGFVTAWEERDGHIEIRQHSCAYPSVARNHREICHLDAELIRTVMGSPVVKSECMFSGQPNCRFEVDIHLDPTPVIISHSRTP